MSRPRSEDAHQNTQGPLAASEGDAGPHVRHLVQDPSVCGGEHPGLPVPVRQQHHVSPVSVSLLQHHQHHQQARRKHTEEERP